MSKVETGMAGVAPPHGWKVSILLVCKSLWRSVMRSGNLNFEPSSGFLIIAGFTIRMYMYANI